MEVAMQVALTGLGCIPFTPRTSFETWASGSKARSKTASQACTGPHGGWNYGQLAAAIFTFKKAPHGAATKWLTTTNTTTKKHELTKRVRAFIITTLFSHKDVQVGSWDPNAELHALRVNRIDGRGAAIVALGFFLELFHDIFGVGTTCAGK